jgi:predicted aspartyl protease
MMTRVPLCALAILSSAVVAQPITTRLEAVSVAQPIDKTTQAQDVKFHTLSDDRLTVPVTVSGQGPYRFLVDTGADRTAISHQIVSTLQLASVGGSQLHSVTGVSPVSTAQVASVEVSKNRRQPVDAVILDSQNMGADGILGVDLLRAQRVQFDFASNVMTIVPSSSPDFRAEPGTIVVNGFRKNGRLIVTDAEANGTHLSVVVDTGAQLSIGNAALRRALLGRGLKDPAEKVELISVTGAKLSGDYMFIRDLKIGGIELNNLVVVFADAHTFDQLNLQKKPALLLGMNAIRAFKKVSIDFANRKFRVLLPEQSMATVRVASAAD